MTSQGSIGDESLSLKGTASEANTDYRKPKTSSNTVSIRKLRGQVKKVRSGEYDYRIHHFDSIKAFRSGSKRNIGLKQSIHQSL